MSSRRGVSRKQKGQLRVVIRNGDRYALYCYADLVGEDLYAGPGAKFLQGARVSHHATGQGHAHVAGQRLLAPVSPPPGSLIGRDRIAGFSYDLAMLDWNYRLKRDAVHRRSLILEAPPIPLSVDLWILQPDRPGLVLEVLDEYRQHKLVGHLHVSVTSPALLAVAFTMTDRARASFADAIARGRP